MACYPWFQQITRPKPASLVLAWLALLVPLGIPAARSQPAAPQAGGGPVGLCEILVGAPSPAVQKRFYVSAIFDVPNDNDKAKWEIAWGYYIQTHDNLSAYSNGGGCTFYRSRAGAEQYLQNRKNNLGGAKLIETGWAYTGPAQLPPPPAPRAGIGPR